MTPKTLIRTLVNNLRVDNLLKLLGHQTIWIDIASAITVDNLLKLLGYQTVYLLVHQG